jgi:hypothetical protein
VTQTRLGGVILTDLKPALGAGSLVRLTRYPDRAEGRFDPTYAAFMGLRHQPAKQTSAQRRPRKQRTGEPEHRTTTLDPRTPWESLVVWFLASFDLGTTISLGYGRPDEDWKPTVTSITTGDGSWAEVTLADDHGVHHVAEGGPPPRVAHYRERPRPMDHTRSPRLGPLRPHRDRRPPTSLARHTNQQPHLATTTDTGIRRAVKSRFFDG